MVTYVGTQRCAWIEKRMSFDTFKRIGIFYCNCYLPQGSCQGLVIFQQGFIVLIGNVS